MNNYFQSYEDFLLEKIENDYKTFNTIFEDSSMEVDIEARRKNAWYKAKLMSKLGALGAFMGLGIGAGASGGNGRIMGITTILGAIVLPSLYAIGNRIYRKKVEKERLEAEIQKALQLEDGIDKAKELRKKKAKLEAEIKSLEEKAKAEEEKAKEKLSKMSDSAKEAAKEKAMRKLNSYRKAMSSLKDELENLSENLNERRIDRSLDKGYYLIIKDDKDNNSEDKRVVANGFIASDKHFTRIEKEVNFLNRRNRLDKLELKFFPSKIEAMDSIRYKYELDEDPKMQKNLDTIRESLLNEDHVRNPQGKYYIVLRDFDGKTMDPEAVASGYITTRRHYDKIENLIEWLNDDKEGVNYSLRVFDSKKDTDPKLKGNDWSTSYDSRIQNLFNNTK
jgi:hypothetical protein